MEYPIKEELKDVKVYYADEEVYGNDASTSCDSGDNQLPKQEREKKDGTAFSNRCNSPLKKEDDASLIEDEIALPAKGVSREDIGKTLIKVEPVFVCEEEYNHLSEELGVPTTKNEIPPEADETPSDGEANSQQHDRVSTYSVQDGHALGQNILPVLHVAKNQDDFECGEKMASADQSKWHEVMSLPTTLEQFKCEHCCKTFTKKGSLKRHQLIHTSERDYACQHCGVKFRRKENLNRHLTMHTGDRPFKCDLCPKRFALRGHVKRHMVIHKEDRPFGCHLCRMAFSRSENLKNHLLLHTGLRPFQCERCSKGFIQKRQLKEHMQQTHADGVSSHAAEDGNTFALGEVPLSQEAEHQSDFECSHCGQKFESSEELMCHRLSSCSTASRKYGCQHCDKFYASRVSLKKHQQVHTSKVLACQHCNVKFKRKESLNRHLTKHTGDRPFECDLCSRRFTMKEHLKRHMVTHMDEKPYECHLCQKRFAQTVSLRNHLILHSGRKPFHCEHCGKGFIQKRLLKEHLQAHTDGISSLVGEAGDTFVQGVTPLSQELSDELVCHPLLSCATATKKFECQQCGKFYASKGSLSKHRQMHTSEELACQYCDMKFKRKESLSRHLAKHTGDRPFECVTCCKRFAMKEHLKRHMITHMDEKPYGCHLCHMKFTRNESLRDHLLLHSGERPFQCERCDKGFIQKRQLKEHLQTHTGEAVLG